MSYFLAFYFVINGTLSFLKSRDHYYETKNLEEMILLGARQEEFIKMYIRIADGITSFILAYYFLFATIQFNF